MKYLLTNDALLIPTREGVLQYSKMDPNFETFLEKVKNASCVEEIIAKPIYYEDDDITVSQEKNTSNIEIFYNGRYFDLNQKLADSFINLLAYNDGFEIQYGINFLKKVIKNPHYNFEQLIDELIRVGFNFLSNGNIVVQKKYEEEGEYDFLRRRQIVNQYDDRGFITFIIVDPSEIQPELFIDEYTVIGSLMKAKDNFPLNTTYIGVPERLIRIYHKIKELSALYKDNLIHYVTKTYDIEIETNITDINHLIETVTRKLENE